MQAQRGESAPDICVRGFAAHADTAEIIACYVNAREITLTKTRGMPQCYCLNAVGIYSHEGGGKRVNGNNINACNKKRKITVQRQAAVNHIQARANDGAQLRHRAVNAICGRSNERRVFLHAG